MKAAKSWREGTKSSNRVCASVDWVRASFATKSRQVWGVCLGGCGGHMGYEMKKSETVGKTSHK